MTSIRSILLSLGLAAASVLPAQAADYVMAPASAVPVAPSVCTQHSVLSHIVNRFAYAESHLLENGLAIQDFSRIQRTQYVPQTNKNPVERHYCRGYANMNDGYSRPIWFVVEEGMGYAGIIGDNVEFCVAEQDPLRVYSGDCTALKSF